MNWYKRTYSQVTMSPLAQQVASLLLKAQDETLDPMQLEAEMAPLFNNSPEMLLMAADEAGEQVSAYMPYHVLNDLQQQIVDTIKNALNGQPIMADPGEVAVEQPNDYDQSIVDEVPQQQSSDFAV